MIRTAFFIAALGVLLHSPSALRAEDRMEEKEGAGAPPPSALKTGDKMEEKEGAGPSDLRTGDRMEKKEDKAAPSQEPSPLRTDDRMEKKEDAEPSDLRTGDRMEKKEDKGAPSQEPSPLRTDDRMEKKEDGVEISDTLGMCFSCHGENGVAEDASIPILAGQHLHYIYTQLKDYKAGRRASPIMEPIAAELEKKGMLELAAFFSEQTWPGSTTRADAAAIKRAETMINSGQCVQCHLGGFEGASGVPRTATQHPIYLMKTMLDFKNRVRLNSAAKGSLLSEFSEADIEAMAHYLASLTVQPKVSHGSEIQ